MKSLMVGMLLVTSTSAALAGDGKDAMSTVSARGEGRWEMICHVTRSGGEQIVRILDPERNSYSDPELRRASCDIKNANKAPLVVSISAPAMACPFKSAGASACEQTFAKGRAGSFELKAGTAR
ncbi:MAG: hypothetical protein WC729_05090 [Sphingomonas sp.]|jgi:hypothetical protein|uniref:hypothetical protein n=1 Tax=Sphingomonas sp. TaxID=28214 RepID=UPI0035638BD0